VARTIGIGNGALNAHHANAHEALQAALAVLGNQLRNVGPATIMHEVDMRVGVGHHRAQRTNKSLNK